MTDFLTTLKELVGKRRSAGESGTRSEHERLDREVKSILSLHAEDIVALVEALERIKAEDKVSTYKPEGFYSRKIVTRGPFGKIAHAALSRLEAKP